MATISKIKLPNNASYDIKDDYSVWGGRNFLWSSQDLTYTTVWYRNSITSISSGQNDPDGGQKAFLITPSSTSWYLAARRNLLTEVGETYTFSIWLKANQATTCNMCVRYLDSEYPYTNNASRRTINLTTDWQFFSITGSLNTSQTVSNSDTFWIGQKTNVPIFAYHPKSEKGNKPTDWSPALEDIMRYIGNNTIELYSE